MRGFAHRLRSEEGSTLIELLVVLGISGILLGALLGLWTGSASRETANAARYESLDSAARAMERMTREVREAVAVQNITASSVHVHVYKRDLLGASPSVLHHITYDCDGPGSVSGTFACTREDETAGTTARLVDTLATSSVFATVAGQPDLAITLSVAVAKANNPIVLRGGASPRNCTGALSACT